MSRLPLLTQLEVRIAPMSVVTPTMTTDVASKNGKIRIGYHVSLFNSGDSPLKIMGKKWIVRESTGEIHIYEGDNVFGIKPLLLPGQLFAFDGAQELSLPATARVMFLVRDDQGLLYHTDPVSLNFSN